MVKAVRITAKHIAEARENAKKDFSPSWNDCDMWTAEEFSFKFYAALKYYNLNYSNKDSKPAVVKWMSQTGVPEKIIEDFKKIKDWRCSTTMGGIASCLLKGMTAQRDDFNNGKDSAEWLTNQINIAIEQGKDDWQLTDELDSTATVENQVKNTTTSIQDKVRDVAARMVEDIDLAIEEFHTNPETFDPSVYKVLGMLKSKSVKPAHARVIKTFYNPNLVELLELANSLADEQLREGYKHRTKRQIRLLIGFYQEIMNACDMIIKEAQSERKPRVRRTMTKDQQVAGLKYKKTDEILKLVSINPISIVDSKELWVYNTKVRKLGRYLAAEFSSLSVKGASIINFDETKSIQKTLRKPAEQLAEFNQASKVVLRRFLDDIPTVDTKLTGRLNEDVIILKVVK